MNLNKIIAEVEQSKQLLEGALADTNTIEGIIRELQHRVNASEALYQGMRDFLSEALYSQIKTIADENDVRGILKALSSNGSEEGQRDVLDAVINHLTTTTQDAQGLQLDPEDIDTDMGKEAVTEWGRSDVSMDLQYPSDRHRSLSLTPMPSEGDSSNNLATEFRASSRKGLPEEVPDLNAHLRTGNHIRHSKKSRFNDDPL